MSDPAVFLDRDGTLIEEAGYIDRLERIQLFPWSLEAIRLLNRAGFRVIVTTNQSGVARGYFDEAFVRSAHEHLGQLVRESGGEVTAFYYCPHHPEGRVAEYRRACDCRKPAPGMFVKAARQHGLDLARSFGIGDRWQDVQTAERAGVTPILVLSGYGPSEAAKRAAQPPRAHVAENLIDATTWILRQHAS